MTESNRIVLLVSGDPSTRTEYRRALLAAGFSVEEATDTVEAAELASRVVPSVVVTDVSPSELGTVELCRELKAQATTEQVAVIGLTGGAAHLMDKVEDARLDAVLSKPVAPKILVAQIRQTLETIRRLRAVLADEGARSRQLQAEAKATMEESRALLEESQRRRALRR